MVERPVGDEVVEALRSAADDIIVGRARARGDRQLGSEEALATGWSESTGLSPTRPRTSVAHPTLVG